MYTLRLWMGSIFFAFGIAFCVWFIKNLIRPRNKRAQLFLKTNVFVQLSINAVWIILGLWIYPIPHTIPLIALIVGLLIGLKFK